MFLLAEYFHPPEPPRITVQRPETLAAYLGRADVLGDDEYAADTADELLERGIMRFEGDPPLRLHGRPKGKCT